MISRILTDTINKKLFQGKAIVITGPRQTGKTTLVKEAAAKSGHSSIYLNADEPDIRSQLENVTSTQIKKIIGNNKILIIDEAQRIQNIGITLKLITDQIKNTQLIVTGSSSLDISNSVNEPLTGRKFEYHLYPLSYSELQEHNGYLEEKRLLSNRLIYGSYPDVINQSGNEREVLTNLADSYLYKDILQLNQIRRPEILENLLEALSLQVGNEVNYSELSQTIGADSETVKKYIELLEKTYVIFRLRSFSRNLRNEIKRSRKIYFYDNGIRNAIIRNYAPVDLRSDIGALWENYLISERVKYNAYNQTFAKIWFWRTKQQQEIDLIEERDGKLSAFEFKWNPKKKAKFSISFTQNYDVVKEILVNPINYDDFLKE